MFFIKLRLAVWSKQYLELPNITIRYNLSFSKMFLKVLVPISIHIVNDTIIKRFVYVMDVFWNYTNHDCFFFSFLMLQFQITSLEISSRWKAMSIIQSQYCCVVNFFSIFIFRPCIYHLYIIIYMRRSIIFLSNTSYTNG